MLLQVCVSWTFSTYLLIGSAGSVCSVTEVFVKSSFYVSFMTQACLASVRERDFSLEASVVYFGTPIYSLKMKVGSRIV
jgi:hypothetical protein